MLTSTCIYAELVQGERVRCRCRASGQAGFHVDPFEVPKGGTSFARATGFPDYVLRMPA